MKLSIRILLCAMAALMILALPFAVPSGSMLEEYQDTWADEAWDSGLIRLAGSYRQCRGSAGGDFLRTAD